MPALDQAQIHHALRAEGLPALERLADTPHLLDRTLRRFDRDDPPPYASSTEEDDDEDGNAMLHPALGFGPRALLDEFKHVMEPPLDDEELNRITSTGSYMYKPQRRYEIEAKIEKYRVNDFASSGVASSDDAKRFLGAGRGGEERMNIIARHNIKKRWEKLGVWGPDWGIPDRLNNPKPNDHAVYWKWWWNEGDSTPEQAVEPSTEPSAELIAKSSRRALNLQDPVDRAVLLRQGLRRGEYSPAIPHSCLRNDTSASQADSFIISRPWFIHHIECDEELRRLSRIPNARRKHFNINPTEFVEEQWKLRGDYREDLETPGGYYNEDAEKPGWRFIPGWKWRHESPTPEPEDLTPLSTMEMDFTPSEVDALEAIPPPTPPLVPKVFFPSDELRDGRGTGPFAGPSHAPPAAPDSLDLPASPETRPLASPGTGPSATLSHAPPTVPDSLDPSEVTPPQETPASRRHGRGRKLRDENPVQPRRSARIAAMKAKLSQPATDGSASSPVSHTATQKQT